MLPGVQKSHDTMIEGKICSDHVHMYVAVPPKVSVSEVMSYIRERAHLCCLTGFLKYRRRNAGRHFGARGYYVSTVRNVNEETIRDPYLKWGLGYLDIGLYDYKILLCSSPALQRCRGFFFENISLCGKI